MATNKMLNLFFHMDFYKDQKPVTKHLYLLYTMMSGMYYESYVRQWFRYFTKIYYIIAIVFLEGCCSVIFFQYGMMNVSVSLLSATMFISGNTTLVIIFNGYYWRENFNKSFEIINEYCNSYENYDKEMEPDDRIINYNKYFKYNYAFPLILLLVFSFFVKLIINCVTLEESSDINPLYDYNYPFPLLTCVDWLSYVLTYLLQTVLLIPLAAIGNISTSMHLLFSIIIRNEVVMLGKEMKSESISITKSLDSFYEQETKILEAETWQKNKNHKFNGIPKECKLYYERFVDHTKKWIFRYQKLLEAMRLLKECFEANSSINLLWQTILCMSFSYISMMALGTKSIEHILYILMLIPIMFACCMSGHLYNSMMDELEKEIYAMPWYYLSSTDRKLILNFLSIVQRPCILKIFKVYPITLNLYPRILMKIFSYLQIIRVMEMKEKN